MYVDSSHDLKYLVHATLDYYNFLIRSQKENVENIPIWKYSDTDCASSVKGILKIR